MRNTPHPSQKGRCSPARCALRVLSPLSTPRPPTKTDEDTCGNLGAREEHSRGGQAGQASNPILVSQPDHVTWGTSLASQPPGGLTRVTVPALPSVRRRQSPVAWPALAERSPAAGGGGRRGRACAHTARPRSTFRVPSSWPHTGQWPSACSGMTCTRPVPPWSPFVHPPHPTPPPPG